MTNQDDSAPMREGEAESRRSRMLELLAMSAGDLLAAQDIPAALDRLFALIRGELGLTVFVHYRHAGEGLLALDAQHGLTPEDIARAATLRFGDAVCGTVARDRRPMVLAELQSSGDPISAFLRGLGLQAYACTPLVFGDALLGTLSFGRVDPPAFSEAEVRFLQTICSHVALAKHRLGVEQELRAGLAERDRLLEEQRAMEQKVIELTRVSALGAVAAMIAHELNQPLSAAVNYVSTIRLSPDPEPARVIDLARSAELQMVRAGEIIRRIRRMVAREGLALEAEDLEALIEESIALVTAALGGLLPSFEIDVAEDAQRAVIDHVQLVQILTNLLRNAVEATREVAEPQVRIETRRISPAEIELCVLDNGGGMSSGIRDAIDEPRIGLSRGALGLGLAISRNLIEAHGGSLRVEQRPGGGTILCFSMPAAPDE